MDRLSLRAWLAIMLAGERCCLSFHRLELGVAGPATPAAVASSSQPEGGGGEARYSDSRVASVSEPAEILVKRL
jgi:hypothetical protein